MKSIICNTTSKVCNIAVGQGSMLPMLKHEKEITWWNSSSVNECSCSRKTPDADCQNFHLQMLFIHKSTGCFINHKYEDKLLDRMLNNSLNMLQVYMWGSSQVINNY